MTDIGTNRPLRIFLCHASGDKPAVRDLYLRLKADGFTPWLDEEDLLPGQDWEREIPRAVRAADVVIVCLSRNSINKEGYVQKEIKAALDVADEKPDDAIFLIPLKLEDCDVPERLRRWQWVDQFEANGYERLIRSLRARAEGLVQSKPSTAPTTPPHHQTITTPAVTRQAFDIIDGASLSKLTYPKSLKMMSDTLDWRLTNEELQEPLLDVINLANRLIKLPKRTRQLFSIVLQRGKTEGFDRLIALVPEIESATGLEPSQLRSEVSILESHRFAQIVEGDPEYEIHVGMANENWMIWDDLKKYCRKKNINLDLIIVDLKFGILDDNLQSVC